jgi:hypothetical protein
MEYIKIASGEISRSYLEKVGRERFDKDFAHISEEERNDAWTQTHDNPTISKGNTHNKRKPADVG